MRNTTVLTAAALAILLLCISAFFMLVERFPILGLLGALLVMLVLALFAGLMLSADARKTYRDRNRGQGENRVADRRR